MKIDTTNNKEHIRLILENAFKKADPLATYKFDWADFGPYRPTDKGKEVLENIVSDFIELKVQNSKAEKLSKQDDPWGNTYTTAYVPTMPSGEFSQIAIDDME